ncbi:hypothetical protein DFJ74DRAFT_707090 [Hyaloraphidium curvatum]|nr:hypothetical protein DFJ74DRAFT_707090 [Hyaloraphidium curvatum]
MARDPFKLIEEWNADLSKDGKAEKYDAISDNPFRFYRGTNHLYWVDNVADPRLDKFGGTVDTACFLVGDCHPENWGTYLNADKEVFYGANDFDDSVVADYQLDVLRMASGLVLSCHVNFPDVYGPTSAAADGTVRENVAAAAVDPFLTSYASEILRLASEKPDPDLVPDFDRSEAKGPIADVLAKIAKKKPNSHLTKATVHHNPGKPNEHLDFDYAGQYAKYQPLEDDDRERIHEGLVASYRRDIHGADEPSAEEWMRIRAIGKRVGAGTGSLGMERYVVLVQGRGADEGLARILDCKTQPLPQPALFLPADKRAEYDARWGTNHAFRMVWAARALGIKPDKHLGWFWAPNPSGGPELSYSVREVTAYKGRLEAEDLAGEGMRSAAGQWGVLLARSHYRTKGKNVGPRGAEDVAAGIAARIGGKEKEFVEHLGAWGFEYAGRVIRDYEEFKANVARK